MAYSFDCPTRWGDMDAYQHLNNASYVDYLQEARVGFLHAGGLASMLGDAPLPDGSPSPSAILVTAHQVEYTQPLEFGRPLLVRLVVESVGAARLTLAYELVSEGTRIARARSVLCPVERNPDSVGADRIRRLTGPERAWFTARVEPVDRLRDIPRARLGEHAAHAYPLRVRWSDLDPYRHVNNVKFYDYVQEARISLLGEMLGRRPARAEPAGQWVVVRQDVEYAAPLDFRTEPYRVRSAVQSLGSSSLTLAAEIDDPGTGAVHATARTVLVHTTARGPAPLPGWLRTATGQWLLPG